MKNKTMVLVVGGMNSGKIAALTAMQDAGLVHIAEYPDKDKQNGLELTEIELDANRGVMPMDYKREVGTYKPDFEVASAWQDFGESVKQFTLEAVKLEKDSLGARRNGNQKWYNQFPKRKII